MLYLVLVFSVLGSGLRPGSDSPQRFPKLCEPVLLDVPFARLVRSSDMWVMIREDSESTVHGLLC